MSVVMGTRIRFLHAKSSLFEVIVSCETTGWSLCNNLFGLLRDYLQSKISKLNHLRISSSERTSLIG